MGSKRRIAKDILPIILENRTSEQWFVDVFTGGGNIIDKVQGNRIGSDLNEYVIALLNEMSKLTFVAPEISENKYNELK